VSPLSRNAFRSIPNNLEFSENEIDCSSLQTKKQNSQMTKTEAGIEIDVRPLQEKALFSIRDNFDFSENEID
jgi:hypothetical protein